MHSCRCVGGSQLSVQDDEVGCLNHERKRRVVAFENSCINHEASLFLNSGGGGFGCPRHRGTV